MSAMEIAFICFVGVCSLAILVTVGVLVYVVVDIIATDRRDAE